MVGSLPRPRCRADEGERPRAARVGRQVAVPLLERLQLQVERRERLLLQRLRLGIRVGLKENALRLAPRPLDARLGVGVRLRHLLLGLVADLRQPLLRHYLLLHPETRRAQYTRPFQAIDQS